MPAYIENQGDAHYNIFSEQRADSNRVRDLAYFGARQGVGYATVNDQAWQAAMDWASQFVFPSFGAKVTFNGYYEISKSITVRNNNVFIEGSGVVPGDGGSNNPTISNLRMLDTTLPAIELGVSKGVNLKGFSLNGSNGTNLNHIGISAGNGRNITVVGVDFHSFGGPAIKATGGQNWDLTRIEVDGCLKGYAALTDYMGAVDLGGGEVFIENCNINGPIGFFVTGQYGSGFACGLNFTGSQMSMVRTTVAASQTGIRLVGILNRLIMVRPEGNQGSGILLDGVGCTKNYIRGCHFNENSQDSNGGYPAIKVNLSTQNCINGNWIGAISGINLCNYFVEDNAAAGDQDFLTNDYYDNTGNAFSIARYHFTNPNNTQKIVGPRNRVQTLTDGAIVTPNAEQGDIWQLSAGGSRTLAAPTNAFKGNRIVLAVRNNTGGAIVTTFNAAYRMSGWVDPAAGKVRTVELYCYDGTNYVQQGTVSPDLTAF